MATFSGSLNDVKSQWFAAQGYTSNDLHHQAKSYLSAQLGITQTTMSLSDLWRQFLKNKGRTEGSYTDMMKAELIASLGAGYSSNMSLTDLERSFYSTSTNTFA